MQQSTIEENVESIQHLLSQFVKLSRRPSLVPQGGVTTEPVSSDAAAPWSWTAAEAANTEAALLPFLIHLAAARGNIESLKYCLKPTTEQDASDSLKLGLIPRGIVNCLEPGSGRSPLHVAALNGHVDSVELLLRSGALVHLRDALGHTALYFVSFLFFYK
jgi:lysophospholipase